MFGLIAISWMFFLLVYHTHRFRSRIAATVTSYPEFMWMNYPEEEWKQGVVPNVKTISHPKSDQLVVILYHEKHFTIMELNFPQWHINVYDGIDVAGDNLYKWHKHITFSLMKCGVISVNSKGE
jgi:hypothetical protein